MVKRELTPIEKIEEATERVKRAMVANIEASRMCDEASVLKNKTRYDLLEAKQSLTAVERELMN
jgi:hypothetical protein